MVERAKWGKTKKGPDEKVIISSHLKEVSGSALSLNRNNCNSLSIVQDFQRISEQTTTSSLTS